MIEIAIPVWLVWILAAAIVLHAIKSIVESLTMRQLRKYVKTDEDFDKLLQALREVAKE